jgi:hypothetical protein
MKVQGKNEEYCLQFSRSAVPSTRFVRRAFSNTMKAAASVLLTGNGELTNQSGSTRLLLNLDNAFRRST